MPIRTRASARGGNAAVIVAIGSVVLLAFAALTLDLGYARLVQQQLENASEAAARAGSLRLDGTVSGLTAAQETAVAVAAENDAGGARVALAEEDVVLGVWDDATGTFTPSADPTLVDTIEVHARIDALALFLAPAVFARGTIPVASTTRVLARTAGAGAVGCFIPLALPDCVVEREGVEGMMDLTLVLNPPGVDNVGWGRPNGTPNASWIKSQIGDCEASGEAAVGDPVGLQNGVVTSGLAELADEIESSATSWDPAKWGTLPTRMSGSAVSASKYGRTYEGPIMVVDGGSEYCTGSGGSFTHDLPLKGFLWAAIFDVKTSGAAEGKTLELRIDTSGYHDVGTAAGGPDYGVIRRLSPRMVRSR